MAVSNIRGNIECPSNLADEHRAGPHTRQENGYSVKVTR